MSVGRLVHGTHPPIALKAGKRPLGLCGDQENIPVYTSSFSKLIHTWLFQLAFSKEIGK